MRSFCSLPPPPPCNYHAFMGIMMGITKVLRLCRFAKDKYVFKEGEVGTEFFILYEGSIMITVRNQERRAEVLLKRLNQVMMHPD
jgi:CRP-like cAMP-binding protein